MEKQKIKTLLMNNGFEEIEKDSFANDYCNVVIEENRIAVANNDGYAEYSKTICSYWLIGCLIYRCLCPDLKTNF